LTRNLSARPFTTDNRMSLVEKYKKRVLEAKNSCGSFDVMMGHGRTYIDPITQKA